MGPLWAYCTECWLKFQDRPGEHHTMRTDLPWWTLVQKSFKQATPGNPLIRAGAVRVDRERLMQQIVGGLTSLTTQDAMSRDMVDGHPTEIRRILHKLLRDVWHKAVDGEELPDIVRQKQAKYFLSRDKYELAQEDLKRLDEASGEAGTGGAKLTRPRYSSECIARNSAGVMTGISASAKSGWLRVRM